MKIEKSWTQRGPDGDWCAYATIYGNKGWSRGAKTLELRWSPTRFYLGFEVCVKKGYLDIFLAFWGTLLFTYNGKEETE